MAYMTFKKILPISKISLGFIDNRSRAIKAKTNLSKSINFSYFSIQSITVLLRNKWNAPSFKQQNDFIVFFWLMSTTIWNTDVHKQRSIISQPLAVGVSTYDYLYAFCLFIKKKKRLKKNHFWLKGGKHLNFPLSMVKYFIYNPFRYSLNHWNYMC